MILWRKNLNSCARESLSRTQRLALKLHVNMVELEQQPVPRIDSLQTIHFRNNKKEDSPYNYIKINMLV